MFSFCRNESKCRRGRKANERLSRTHEVKHLKKRVDVNVESGSVPELSRLTVEEDDYLEV